MFCASCGKQLRKDDRFCTSCGKKVAQDNNDQENEIQEKNDAVDIIAKKDSNLKKEVESSLKKTYFKCLISITIIFGLLEVLLIFLMPFGEIHAKVLATMGLIALFGILGSVLIGLYETTNHSKYPFIGIGVNVVCFCLSSLLTWEIFSSSFLSKTTWSFVILLFGLIIISFLHAVPSKNKYIEISKNITSFVILVIVFLYSLNIYNSDLFSNDLFVRLIWALDILAVLGLVTTPLLGKIE